MMTFGKALYRHIQTAMGMVADAERGYAMLRSVGLSAEDACRVVQASQRGDDDPVLHHRRLSAAARVLAAGGSVTQACAVAGGTRSAAEALGMVGLAQGLERGCEALRRASMNAEEATRAFARFCPPTSAENNLLDLRLSKQGKRQARRRGV